MNKLLFELIKTIVKNNNLKYIRLKFTVHGCHEINSNIDCNNSHISSNELLREIIQEDECGYFINVSLNDKGIFENLFLYTELGTSTGYEPILNEEGNLQFIIT